MDQQEKELMGMVLVVGAVAILFVGAIYCAFQLLYWIFSV